MVAVSKFLFETSFDAAAGSAAAPPPSRRAYPAQEVEAIKAAVRAEAFAAGRAEAERSIEAQTRDLLGRIGAQLAAMVQDADRLHAERTEQAVGAAAAMVRKLMPDLASRHALAEIEALLRDCLGRLHDEPRIVVRVHDELLDPLRRRVDAIAQSTGFGGRVILIADPGLAATDARIEWADGGAERNLGAVWQDIDAALRNYLQGGHAA